MDQEHPNWEANFHKNSVQWELTALKNEGSHLRALQTEKPHARCPAVNLSLSSLQ